MKKAMALFCTLSALGCFSCMNPAFAASPQNFGMFSSTNPVARSQILGTPARLPMPLGIGISGYSVENVSEYGNVAVNTSFNIRMLRIGAVVDYTAMDTLYKRLRSQWEFAYAVQTFGFGAAYNLDMEMLNEDISEEWALHKILFGAYGKFPEYFMYAGLLKFPLDDGVIAYDLAFYWVLNSYTLYVEFEYENEHSMQIGQELFFGSWGVECAYKYPGSRLYLGFAIWFDNWNVFAGAASVSRDYLGRVWKLEYER